MTQASIPTISYKIQNQPFGCLIYDIPVSESRVYEKVKRIIRKTALPMNLSVYLVPWALRDQIEELLKEHMTHRCDIKFIKFDDSSIEELSVQVERSLLKLVAGIYRRIDEKVQEVKKKTATQQYDFKYDIEKRIEDVETLIAIFGLTQDVQDAVKAVKMLYKAEVEVL